jgi:transposase
MPSTKTQISIRAAVRWAASVLTIWPAGRAVVRSPKDDAKRMGDDWRRVGQAIDQAMARSRRT